MTNVDFQNWKDVNHLSIVEFCIRGVNVVVH